MSKLIWDQVGERIYETGVDHGVLYPSVNGLYPKGVAWSGLVSVSESPSGAEDNPQYADNIKYLNVKSAEEYGATVECFTYPEEWEKCDGSAELAPGITIGQQARQNFGMCYRSRVGNDSVGDDYGYKIHIIYGASASPSERSYSTVNDSPEAITFSFEIATTPVTVTGHRPTASLVIDSTKVDETVLAKLEEILYGKDAAGDDDEGVDARLPLPDEIMSIIKAEG